MHCNGKCFFMRKIKEAQDNEKKQDKASQQNHYQEALPAILPVSLLTYNEGTPKITYPVTGSPATIQRESSILLPPKIV